MKRELTLADIAGYLPYDLKVQDRDQDFGCYANLAMQTLAWMEILD